jgi:hypothetical protein
MINQYTFQYSSWDELPTDFQAFFTQLMGNELQVGHSFFSLYYYWYNVIHECGHILRKQYGTAAESRWIEESAVHDFAVSYWQNFGEQVRLDQLRDCLHEAIRLLPNPILPDEEPAQYFDTHHQELAQNPPEYAYLQFAWVLTSLEKNVDLVTALRSLISPSAQTAGPLSPRFYPEINVDLPLLIIPDMREVLSGYGIALPPVQIVRGFSPSLQFVSFTQA